jgi:hypothetical protein
MTNPAAMTMSIGLLASAPLSWFLHRHLDNFIVTRQLAAVYRDFAILTTLSSSVLKSGEYKTVYF